MHNHLSLDHLLHSNSTSENKKGSPPSSNLIKEVKVFHPTTNPTTSLTSFALHLFSKKEGEREGSLTFNNSPVVSLESMTQPSSSLALTPFPLFSTSTSTTSTSTSTSTSNGHSNSNSHFSVPSSTFFNENNPSQFDSWSKWLPWANSYLSSTSSNKLISLPHSPPPPPPPPPLPPFIHPIMISQHTNPHPHPHPLPHQQQSLLQPQQQYFHYYCRPPLPSEGSSFSHFNASSNDPLTIPFHRRSSLPSTVFSYPTTSFTNTFSGSMHTLLQRGDPTNTLLHHPPPFTSSSTSTHSTQPEPKHFDVATSHLPSNPRSLSLQSKPLHASSLSYPPPFNPFLTSIPTDLSTSTPFTSTSTATMQATSTHPSSVLTYSPPPSSENGFQAFSLFTPSTLSAPFLPHSPSTSQCTQDLTTTPSLSIPCV
ncbi:hypothetical protein HMI54_005281 [Coelomomyces lativittatus]|nr:hypothetical protein HMI54_005281 [Coelomomyces lativittatus]